MNKSPERKRKPKSDGLWEEGDLDLGKDLVSKMRVVHCLKIIGSKPITYKNDFPLKKKGLIS